MSVSVYNLTRFTALAAGDVLPAVDVSDTTQSAHGSLDSITVTNFFATIPVPVNVTSASATALAVGLAGATNSAFQVDASTALQAAGLKVTGAVAAGTVAVAVISSGSNASLSLAAKGTGTITCLSPVTVTSTTTPQGTLKYDATHYATLSVDSSGNLTIATGTSGTGQPVKFVGSNVHVGDDTTSGSIALAVRMATATLTGSGQRGISSDVFIGSQATVYCAGMHSAVTFQDASYTTPDAFGIRFTGFTKPAAVTVNTAYGLKIYDINSIGGTNNYGIYVADITGTGAFGIYTGLGANSFGADLTLRAGNLAVSAGTITASGDITISGGADFVVAAGRGILGSDTTRFVGYTTNDGVQFNQNQGGTAKLMQTGFRTNGGFATEDQTIPSAGIRFGTSAPSSLADGQIWYDGTDFKVRTGGATKTITIT